MSDEVRLSGNLDEVSPEVQDASGQPESAPVRVVDLAPVTDYQVDPVPEEPGIQDAGQQVRSREPGVADAQLVTRMMVGLLTAGGEGLMQMLRDLEQDLETHPELVDTGGSEDADTTVDLLRYLSIGLLMRGQRAAIRGTRGGLYLSLGTAGWIINGLDTLTDNWLLRPIRRPFEWGLGKLEETAAELIIEGKREELISRQLAQEAATETMDDVVEVVAENPEVTSMLMQVVGGQTANLATVVVDNTRQISMTSDDAIEGLLRRLLRRTPRSELPPSPLTGESQTMYLPEAPEEQQGHDEQ